MTTLTRRASAALALMFVSLFSTMSSAPAPAASITTQPRCAGPGDWCLSFGAADVIPVIRGVTFNAPKAGTAQVTFHGSLYCAGFAWHSIAIARYYARADLVSQIVNKQNLVPDPGKAGSLRHAAGIGDALDFFSWSTTFSLASTRVFTINAAGPQKYYFKIARLLQDPTITCYVYNATFTIVFI